MTVAIDGTADYICSARAFQVMTQEQTRASWICSGHA